jgi:hypothetical protein
LGVGFVLEVLPLGCVVVVAPCFVPAEVVVVVVLVDDAVLLACDGVAVEDGVVGAAGVRGGVTGSPGFGSGLDVILAINSFRPVSEPLFRYL